MSGKHMPDKTKCEARKHVAAENQPANHRHYYITCTAKDAETTVA